MTKSWRHGKSSPLMRSPTHPSENIMVFQGQRSCAMYRMVIMTMIFRNLMDGLFSSAILIVFTFKGIWHTHLVSKFSEKWLEVGGSLTLHSTSKLSLQRRNSHTYYIMLLWERNVAAVSVSVEKYDEGNPTGSNGPTPTPTPTPTCPTEY